MPIGSGLWLAIRINIFGFGLTGLWNTLNSIILPDRVTSVAPEALRGTALGLITFIGIGLAAVIQPIAGRVSDQSSARDRRKPFITLGGIGVALCLVVFGWAPTFAFLLIAYVAMQLASNVAQAAFQGLIPDLVAEDERGLASGVKNGLNVLGIAVGLAGARLLLGLDRSQWPVIGFLGVLVLATAGLNHLWTPKVPPVDTANGQASLRKALDLRLLWREITETLAEHRTFRLAVIMQFLFLLGIYPVQRFLLFFLEERFGKDHILERTTIVMLVAVVLAIGGALIAGRLSDRLGRRRVLRRTILLGGIGLAGLAIAPWWLLVIPTGFAVAVSLGAFQSVNWALLSDEIPEGKGAGYYGVANIATAGAGAIAGLFGPLVDVLNAVLPSGSFLVTFMLSASIALSSLLALRRIAVE